MDRGSLDTSDVLLYRGLGGPGAYGYGYGANFPGDGSVVNNNAERNALDIAKEGSITRSDIREQSTDNKLATILAATNAFRAESQRDLSEFRSEVQRDIADARAEAAECCCETQKLVLTENNATRTLLLEQRIAQQDQTINQQNANRNNDAILAAINGQTQLLTALVTQTCSRGNS